ncbi:MAG: hypothetical protein JRI23_18140 [Deltaproteobacteria bacterium]|jgi:hypothetical protein|nr:hypothetical protein [Deltaproteobacteria bacterium]MBW2533767.1 hypothetical protein [Deltaproteobacteria bacterium]
MALHLPTASKRLLGITLAIAATATLAPQAARADDKATAQVLFEAARKLMDEGKYAEACPKLAESHRLDPGGGTLLNLAVCHENEGKTATAWGEFKEALGMARADGRQDRISLAEERIAALEPKLSRLVVTVAPEAKVAGLVVTVDGTEMGEPVWGIATPVDPGQRKVSARAPSHEPWETTVTLGAEADQQAVQVPKLEPSATAPAPMPGPTAPAGPGTAPPPPPDDGAPSDGSTQRLVGYIVGGAGLASAVVGGIFGGLAISKNAEAEDAGCDDTTCPSPDALDASDSAKTNATLSNVFVGAGLGLVAVGVIVVLTAPDGSGEEASTTAIAPWLGPNEGGVVARFAW